ncbi:MAG: 2-amino-4-hydroxy-6-hydroxymethyldihydropteridine diphosphokinase [Acidimicrobiales bacterium]
MRAFLGLGSNMGDRWGHLRAAAESLGDVVAMSPVYETDPVGGPPGQGPYLNMVIELETRLSPRQLLGICHRLEAAAGRVRGERWGPRPLDVDILLVGDLTVDEADLVVPHPLMWNRRFVVEPLADLAPDMVPPGWQGHLDGSVHKVGTL